MAATKAATAPFILLDDQTISMSLNGQDDAGNAVPLPADAVATWTTTDPEGLLSLVANGLSATVTATGKLSAANPPAPAQVNVSVTSASFAGPITGSLSIQINPSALATIAITPGTPAHK